MKVKIPLRALLFCAAALVVLATSQHAAAQSCALCYQSASAAGPRAIHALRNGILILMFPPVFISGALAMLVYRRRNIFNS